MSETASPQIKHDLPPPPTDEISRLAEMSKVTNEEYKIWKKQSPFLYDISISKALTSPATSVQWYPQIAPWSAPTNDSNFVSSTLLMTSTNLLGGTNTVSQNTCDLPQFESGQIDNNASIRIVDPKHQEDLGPDFTPLKARYSSLNPQLYACGGTNGNLRIFQDSKPSFNLEGHKNDIHTIDWSRHDPKLLLSGSADGTACIWDIETKQSKFFHGNNSIGNLESKAPSVYCAEFAPLNANELATSGDDRVIEFWDTRSPLTKSTRAITDAHSSSITALNYSPFNEMLLATGSADGAVAVWDVRMSSASLVGLQSSAGAVSALKWSLHEESVFATGSTDSQVKVWDLSLHGVSQTVSEEVEGPPELLFIHGGHLAPITDFDWHPTLPWTICSVAEDCLVDVWKIASAIVDTPKFTSDDETGN